MWSDIVVVNGVTRVITVSVFADHGMQAWFLRAVAQGDRIAAVAQAAGPDGVETCKVVDNRGNVWDSNATAFGVSPCGILVHPQGWQVTWMEHVPDPVLGDNGPRALGRSYGRAILDLNLNLISRTTIPNPYGNTSQGFFDDVLDGTPIFADQNRTIQRGPVTIGLWSRRGPVTIGQDWTADRVIAWHEEKAQAFEVFRGNTVSQSHVAIDGSGNAVAVIANRADPIPESKWTTWTPWAKPVPKINRALWVGFFSGWTDDRPELDAPDLSLPGNCYLHVYKGDAHPFLTVKTLYGRSLFDYVSGVPDGDVDSLEDRARSLASGQRPVIGYWTAARQTDDKTRASRVPDVDIVGVEAYKGRLEGDTQFFERIERAILRCRDVGRPVCLIAQCYTSNTNNTDDLQSIPPVIAQLALQYPDVIAILIFNGSGRPTGFSDHPEVHSAWRALIDSVRTPTPPVTVSPSATPSRSFSPSFSPSMELGEDTEPTPTPTPTPDVPEPAPAPKKNKLGKLWRQFVRHIRRLFS